MVIDPSVFLALLLNEAEAERFAHALVEAPTRFISAATVLEASIVIQSRFSGCGQL